MLRSLFVGASLALVACARPLPATNATQPTPVKAVLPDTSGVWDWSFFSRDDQGDERFESEEWHLTQRGGAIEGYYDRVVDMRSVDDRLFRCNQKLSFRKYTRVTLIGRIDGNRVSLRETDFRTVPNNPCDDGARNLVEYRGVIAGGNIALRWGAEGGQTLVRRMDSGRPSLAESSGVVPASNTMSATGRTDPAGPEGLQGTWEWELRSIDAEGDLRVEREEWHLTESSEGIRGYYDRTVRKERGTDQPFECNGRERFETATRYTVVGQRAGDMLMITEVDFKSEKTPCDNAQRRLDTYRGKLTDPNTLILSWGPGNQLLRRKK
jgi:hypothetical protein